MVGGNHIKSMEATWKKNLRKIERDWMESPDRIKPTLTKGHRSEHLMVRKARWKVHVEWNRVYSTLMEWLRVVGVGLGR